MTPQEATLSEIFPQIHPGVIQQVLVSKNYSVRDAHQVLLTMSDAKKDASSISSSSSSSSSAHHSSSFSRKCMHDHPRCEVSSSSENWRSTSGSASDFFTAKEQRKQAKRERKEQKRRERECRRYLSSRGCDHRASFSCSSMHSITALREQMVQTANTMSNHASHAANTVNNQTMQAFSSVNNTMNNQMAQANNAIYTIRTKSGDIPLNGPIGSIVGLGILAAKKAASVYNERKDKKEKEKEKGKASPERPSSVASGTSSPAINQELPRYYIQKPDEPDAATLPTTTSATNSTSQFMSSSSSSTAAACITTSNSTVARALSLHSPNEPDEQPPSYDSIYRVQLDPHAEESHFPQPSAPKQAY
ncbi:hypothetical protein K492DRAFT_204696 [Lichtheimia hyalospora FSU 10163]|nr:hypothetical protein K492DRAFT_204696 [Lichtheimia hyalospora FSU 10163]